MRLLPSDPDIETIVSRIKNGDIDLQPAFQRGEVWSRAKQQRLIDSILRDWHVPPIHVVENATSKKQEVLDGQQRLASIRDFVDGLFPVDGDTEPLDEKIKKLDGLKYCDLDRHWIRQFNQFTIRVFRIVDYETTEPAELFFRLNQPASLTGAEQRNAFFGPVREQIKNLVAALEQQSSIKRFLVFSNARMSYDDVLARVALAVERRTLAQKITSQDLTELYRRDTKLSRETIQLVETAIDTLGSGMRLTNASLKFNKATLFSWMIFLVRGILWNSQIRASEFAHFVDWFAHFFHDPVFEPDSKRLFAKCAPAGPLLSIYATRSASRVADVSSVILRDAIIWLVCVDFLHYASPDLRNLLGVFALREAVFEPDILARRIIDSGWGRF
jgi:hypothetical protein